MEGMSYADIRRRAMDVTDDASVQGTIDEILAAEGRLDILVNNAGVICAGTMSCIGPKYTWLTPIATRRRHRRSYGASETNFRCERIRSIENGTIGYSAYGCTKAGYNCQHRICSRRDVGIYRAIFSLYGQLLTNSQPDTLERNLLRLKGCTAFINGRSPNGMQASWRIGRSHCSRCCSL